VVTALTPRTTARDRRRIGRRTYRSRIRNTRTAHAADEEAGTGGKAEEEEEWGEEVVVAPAYRKALMLRMPLLGSDLQ
jgi:hypothetical protein